VKIKSNILGVTLVLSIGIILTSAGSAFSVLGATPNATAGNMSKASGAAAGNMSNASNTTSKVLTNASKVVGGGLKGLGAMMSSPNNTKVASKVLTNISQAVGGGLKGLGNLLSPGKK
jgi:hypothetical protein